MSYEGYTQNICDNGHLFENDCYSEHTCHCGSDSVWSNQVDQTNSEDVGFIPQSEFDKLLISKAVYQTCNLGHTHLIHEAIYRLPKNGELQRYWKPWLKTEYEPY